MRLGGETDFESDLGLNRLHEVCLDLTECGLAWGTPLKKTLQCMGTYLKQTNL